MLQPAGIVFCIVVVLICRVSATMSYLHRANNEEVKVKYTTKNESAETYMFFQMRSPNPAGWVGCGLNSKSSMKGADLVIGWIENGVGQIKDLHGIANDKPNPDKKQSYTLVSATQDANGFTIEFKRSLKTCDPEDFKFSLDHTYLLYAYSEVPPTKEENGEYNFASHGFNNHFVSVQYMLSGGQALDPREKFPEDVTSNYTIAFDNFIIPPKPTTYWCQVLKIPEKYQENKHFFIGWIPLFNKKTSKYFHHGTIGQCRGNRTLLEEKVAKLGYDCTSAEKFQELLGCLPVQLSYAVGFPGEYYPSDIAFPFGEKFNGSDFLFYQAHFNNPDMDKDVQCNLGVQLLLTDKPRKHIAGKMLIMSSVDYTLAIPPKQPSFVISAICPQMCTNLLSGTVTVFAVNGHMHTLGRKFVIRHFDENGVEKPTIFEDSTYIFDSQDSVILPKRILIQPGDRLMTECYYDSTEREQTTLGGLATNDEMCASDLYIYPIQNFQMCMAAFDKTDQGNFVGVKDFDQMTGQTKDGRNMADIITEYQWSGDKVKQFQEMAWKGKRWGLCVGTGGQSMGMFKESINITKEYQKPKDECRC